MDEIEPYRRAFADSIRKLKAKTCYHSPDECRLAWLQQIADCECPRDTCPHTIRFRAVTEGEVAYSSPSHRTAFREGWNAYIAQWPFEANRSKTRGHRWAWEAGWAWAHHYRAVDTAELAIVMRALGDPDAPECFT